MLKGCHIQIASTPSVTLFFTLQGLHRAQGELYHLLMQAEHCSIAPKKIQFYQSAIKVCEFYGFHQKKAEIYCALFYLEPHLGLQHAESAILADPYYGEVSHF
jgi:hypothetical protein